MSTTAPQTRAREFRSLCRLLRCMLMLALCGLSACSLESRFYRPKSGEFATPAGCRDIVIPIERDQALHGWFIPGPMSGEHAAADQPLIIFCHGSATTIDELEPRLRPIAEAAEASLLLFSYRGYGRSSALRNITRASTVSDTRAALSYARTLRGIDTERIVLFGYSLGAVPALAVAAEDPGVAGVIIGGAYSTARDALDDLGRGWAYPLIGSAFDPSRSAASLGSRPFYVFHGAADSSCPVYHAYANAASATRAGVPTTLRVVEHAGHFDILESEPALIEEIAAFVRSVPPRKGHSP